MSEGEYEVFGDLLLRHVASGDPPARLRPLSQITAVDVANTASERVATKAHARATKANSKARESATKGIRSESDAQREAMKQTAEARIAALMASGMSREAAEQIAAREARVAALIAGGMSREEAERMAAASEARVAELMASGMSREEAERAEARAQLEARIEALMAGGMSREEAERQAGREQASQTSGFLPPLTNGQSHAAGTAGRHRRRGRSWDRAPAIEVRHIKQQLLVSRTHMLSPRQTPRRTILSPPRSRSPQQVHTHLPSAPPAIAAPAAVPDAVPTSSNPLGSYPQRSAPSPAWPLASPGRHRFEWTDRLLPWEEPIPTAVLSAAGATSKFPFCASGDRLPIGSPSAFDVRCDSRALARTLFGGISRKKDGDTRHVVSNADEHATTSTHGARSERPESSHLSSITAAHILRQPPNSPTTQ